VHALEPDQWGSGVIVAGTPHKALDPKGRYHSECKQLSDALGWDDTLYTWWQQLTLLRMYEQGWPRPVAAWQAMRDVKACFCKPGSEGD
jgi:hypothetical protein